MTAGLSTLETLRLSVLRSAEASLHTDRRRRIASPSEAQHLDLLNSTTTNHRHSLKRLEKRSHRKAWTPSSNTRIRIRTIPHVSIAILRTERAGLAAKKGEGFLYFFAPWFVDSQVIGTEQTGTIGLDWIGSEGGGSGLTDVWKSQDPRKFITACQDAWNGE